MNANITIPFLEGLKAGLGLTYNYDSNHEFHHGQRLGLKLMELPPAVDPTIQELKKQVEELTAKVQALTDEHKWLENEVQRLNDMVLSSEWGSF